MPEELDVSIIWHHFTGAANFQVKALAVSLENSLGKFDILPGHANLVGVIHNSIMIQTIDKRTNVYPFKQGIVEVSENSVKLFLEGKKIVDR